MLIITKIISPGPLCDRCYSERDRAGYRGNEAQPWSLDSSMSNGGASALNKLCDKCCNNGRKMLVQLVWEREVSAQEIQGSL